MDFQNGFIYLDTNIVIYAIEGFEKYWSIRDGLLGGLDEGRFRCLTSELTLAEALVKPFRENNKVLASAYQSFLSGRKSLQVAPITKGILLTAASYRAERKIQLADAIHLATAISCGCHFFLTNDGRLGSPRGIAVVQISDLSSWGEPGVREKPAVYKARRTGTAGGNKKRRSTHGFPNRP